LHRRTGPCRCSPSYNNINTSLDADLLKARKKTERHEELWETREEEAEMHSQSVYRKVCCKGWVDIQQNMQATHRKENG